ncbi:MAG: pseudouridine synthase [Lysobacter sp.]|nr:pseudouridine synthase [Lysobacter sp.]
MKKQQPARTLSLKREKEAAIETERLEERLHKVLAQAGLGSRRALEQRIADGMIKVNGETAQVGMSVKGGDRIEIDGKTFVASALTEPARVLMYNKPEGEVTTREDPEGRPTIFEALPVLKGARWIAIGRLDINTTGLLLLTTDGELANAMMHPSFEIEREYLCRVRAPEGEENVSDKLVDRLHRGVALEDGPAKFEQIERIGGTNMPDESRHDWFRVTLSEGRNREVRRLWESQGCQVSRLKRIRYGDVMLPQPLLRGQSQELAATQVEALRKKLNLEEGPPPALTLQPVIGQRKAAKSTVHVGREGRSQAYVNGHNTADEGRELRRFDHVREDRGRFGNKKKRGDLTVSGEAAARQSQNKPFKQRPQKGPKPLPDGNPAAFRTWYVPEGVDTGPTGHRNADARGPKKPYVKKPYAKSPGGGQGGYAKPRGYAGEQTGGQGGYAKPRSYSGDQTGGQGPAFGGEQGGGYAGQGHPYKRRGRSQAGQGGPGQGGQSAQGGGYQGGGYRGDAQPGYRGDQAGPGDRRSRGPAPQGAKPARPARPYGHPGSAPSFPSDHAGGGYTPYGDQPPRGPRGPRPQGPGGPKFGGPKPAGRPGGNPGGPKFGGPKPAGRGPGGPRPGGPRPAGPRPGGRGPGPRGPRGGGAQGG